MFSMKYRKNRFKAVRLEKVEERIFQQEATQK
jgi:hypothetical protein